MPSRVLLLHACHAHVDRTGDALQHGIFDGPVLPVAQAGLELEGNVRSRYPGQGGGGSGGGPVCAGYLGKARSGAHGRAAHQPRRVTPWGDLECAAGSWC